MTNFDYLKSFPKAHTYITYLDRLHDTSSIVPELLTLENSGRYMEEILIDRMLKEYRISYMPDTSLQDKIDLLFNRGVIDMGSKDNYHVIRMAGNVGSHNNSTDEMSLDMRNFRFHKIKTDDAFRRICIEAQRFAKDYMEESRVDSFCRTGRCGRARNSAAGGNALAGILAGLFIGGAIACAFIAMLMAMGF